MERGPWRCASGVVDEGRDGATDGGVSSMGASQPASTARCMSDRDLPPSRKSASRPWGLAGLMALKGASWRVKP